MRNTFIDFMELHTKKQTKATANTQTKPAIAPEKPAITAETTVKTATAENKEIKENNAVKIITQEKTSENSTVKKIEIVIHLT